LREWLGLIIIIFKWKTRESFTFKVKMVEKKMLVASAQMLLTSKVELL
jgi:hypothetical protein